MLGVLCASIGSIQVNEAIKLLAGIGEPLVGRLMIYDALEMQLPPGQGPQGPGLRGLRREPDRHRAHRLRGLLRRRLRGGPGGRGRFDDHSRSSSRSGSTTARSIEIIDVREPNEYEIVSIPGAKLIPKNEFLMGTALQDLPQDKKIVLHCKTGVRSRGGPRRAEVRGLRGRRARRRRRHRLGQPDRAGQAGLLNGLSPTAR